MPTIWEDLLGPDGTTRGWEGCSEPPPTELFSERQGWLGDWVIHFFYWFYSPECFQFLGRAWCTASVCWVIDNRMWLPLGTLKFLSPSWWHNDTFSRGEKARWTLVSKQNWRERCTGNVRNLGESQYGCVWHLEKWRAHQRPLGGD